MENDMPDVHETIVRLIAIELKVSEQDVRKARSLKNDLSMDSIAAANLLFALEEEYGIEMNLDDVSTLDTLPELEDVVSRSLAADAT
jgi:acyl carrier protein